MERQLSLRIAIDRATQFAFVELPGRATRRITGDFLCRVVETVPAKLLTDNGTHFTTRSTVASAASIIRQAIAAGETFHAHSFKSACARDDSDRRLARPRHPWTNGQVERMTRTTKDATVQRCHDDRPTQLGPI